MLQLIAADWVRHVKYLQLKVLPLEYLVSSSQPTANPTVHRDLISAQLGRGSPD